ncbi:MAG: hypothetical protein FWB98_07110, partial [Defluviitaleaceae bacterium]|nr:hypothetical protein [Defluviitaleaceae bacterium]
YATNPQMLTEGWFLWLVWGVLAWGMLFRLIPNKKIPIGARKHNPCSHNPSHGGQKPANIHKGAVAVALFWLACVSAAVFVMRLTGFLNPQTMIILTLALLVLDIAFILFYCPLQRWFMKNHCCTTCRIYNWDYLMIAAPLVIFPSFFSISLVILAVAVVVRWETALISHPERFSAKTNKNLRCSACTDKLCSLNIIKKHK